MKLTSHNHHLNILKSQINFANKLVDILLMKCV